MNNILKNISKLIIALSAITFTSCQYFQNTKEVDPILAEANNTVLTLSQVQHKVPSSLKGNDSIMFVQNYVERWIHNQLMLEKAVNNIDKETFGDIENMVNDYRTALLVYKYQQMYIEQNLDTIVSDSLIENHYQKYGFNFLLDSAAVKAIYVQIPKSLPNGVSQVRKLLRNINTEKGIVDFEEFCYKNARGFNIGNEWLYLHTAFNQLPEGSVNDPLAVAKSGRSVEYQDSLYHYFFMVREFRNVNEQAPLALIKEKITEILLNHRKSNIIKELEIQIYINAVNKKRFENYVN